MCRGSHKRAGQGRIDLSGRSLPQPDLATDLAHTHVIVFEGLTQVKSYIFISSRPLPAVLAEHPPPPADDAPTTPA